MKKRARVVRLYLTESEKATLEQLADAHDTTQADYLRRLIRNAAQHGAPAEVPKRNQDTVQDASLASDAACVTPIQPKAGK